MTPQEQINALNQQWMSGMAQRQATSGMESGRQAAQQQQQQYMAQMTALQNAMMQANGGAGATGPAAEMAANRDRIYANTEGRAAALGNDPNFNTSMDFLRGVVGGQNTPYNDQTQAAMMAQNGRGTASAEAAQMEALRGAMGANGGSVADPSYQSALREAMSQRQGQNLDFAGQLAAKANLENFRARSGAANQMAGINSGQNAQINQMLLAGSGYRAQESRSVPTGSTMTTTGGQWGGTAPQQQPSQWMGYQQTPQRYVAPNSGYTAPQPRTTAPQQPATYGYATQGTYSPQPQQQPQTNPQYPYGFPVAGRSY